MSASRSWRLIPLWLRLKRLLRTVLINRPRWKHLHELYSIVNDWITLTRESPKPSDDTTPSPPGPQAGVDPAQPGKPENYRLY